MDNEILRTAISFFKCSKTNIHRRYVKAVTEKNIEHIIDLMVSEYIGKEKYFSLKESRLVSKCYQLGIYIDPKTLSLSSVYRHDNISVYVSGNFPIYKKGLNRTDYISSLPENIREKYLPRLLCEFEELFCNINKSENSGNTPENLAKFYENEILENPKSIIYRSWIEKDNNIIRLSKYEKELDLLLKLKSIRNSLSDQTLIYDKKFKNHKEWKV